MRKDSSTHTHTHREDLLDRCCWLVLCVCVMVWWCMCVCGGGDAYMVWACELHMSSIYDI
jgi:hypothetical protein